MKKLVACVAWILAHLFGAVGVFTIMSDPYVIPGGGSADTFFISLVSLGIAWGFYVIYKKLI